MGIVAAVFISGCGSPPPPPMDREVYDKFMMAQFDILSRGRASKAEIEKLYTKHNVSKETISEAQKLWGEPEAVEKKRLAILEKMTVGAK